MEPHLSDLPNQSGDSQFPTRNPPAAHSRVSSAFPVLPQHPPSKPENSHQTGLLLSPAHQRLLRSQILAYKHLVRNLAPVRTEPTWNPQSWQNYRRSQSVTTTQRLIDKTEKEDQIRLMVLANSKRDEDPDQFRSLLEKRKNEIQHHLEKSQDFAIHTRFALQIEARLISLREFYQHLTARLSQGISKDRRTLNMFSDQLLDRSYFRRLKLTRSEKGKTEGVENQMKSEHQRRKRVKHRQIMQQLRSHREEFCEWHRKKLKDRKKVAAQARTFIENKRKDKEEAEEKRKITRLKILREQNMIEYLAIVEEEKKSKIRELLVETNKFLKELGAKVLVQKSTEKGEKNKDAEGPIADEPREDEEQKLKEIFEASNSIYYNLTHTIKEDVKKQPSMLTGGELKSYQLHGLQWLVSLYNNNLNGILADEMGLGKTIQTISLICYLIEMKKNTGPFLIIAPLSTISNWMAEFEKWAPAVRKVVYKGNPASRTESLRQMRLNRWNVCITTYDFILKDRLKLNKYDWKYIVIDEGHKMKNAKSKFANVLGQQYSSEHRLLLTGTPLQNNLGELWALLNFLLPKVFNCCDDFQKWFSMAVFRSTGDETVQLDEEEQLLIINRLHQVLRPFLLRRVKKEVYSELPDKKEHVIKVEMSAWQQLIYSNISNNTALQYASNSGKVSKTTLTNLVMQLRKCCNHPFLFLKHYDDLTNDWLVRSSGKFELLDRILPKLKRFNHRVLIFTQMTQLMDIMETYFWYRGVRHLRLDGSTKPEDREQRMRLFNEPNSSFDVFLLSTRAGGLGLNLQTADTVIIFDSDWNPQMDLQAQDRVHRIGQEKEVIVLRLVTNNSIQEHILERTAFKMNLTELFIQGGLYNLNSSEAERRQKIEDILLKRKNNSDQIEDEEVFDDDMLNQYLRRSDAEYEEFTVMDRAKMHEESHQRSRLMKYQEIPAWFIETPKAVETNKEYGRGNRTKRAINYSDEPDEQFLINLGDFGEIEASAEPPPRRARPKVSAHREEEQESDLSVPQPQKYKIKEDLFEEDDN